jgi:hypothetical protein
MKAISVFIGLIAAATILAVGCGSSTQCTVTQYGPNLMKFTGSSELFNSACREALQQLSHRIQGEGNSVSYPDYGEGISTHSADKQPIASIGYLKTKGEDGAEYKVTILRLGKDDPVVMLESTSSDPHRLVNALNAEFHKQGVEVRQY